MFSVEQDMKGASSVRHVLSIDWDVGKRRLA